MKRIGYWAIALALGLGGNAFAQSETPAPAPEGVPAPVPEKVEEKPADFLAAEMSARLAGGPAVFHVVAQLAGPGDDPTDATAVWPDDREEVAFGTLTVTERVDELAPERRKIIFDPVPRVDGIDPAGDPLTEVRSEIYLVSGRRRRAAT